MEQDLEGKLPLSDCEFRVHHSGVMNDGALKEDDLLCVLQIKLENKPTETFRRKFHLLKKYKLQTYVPAGVAISWNHDYIFICGREGSKVEILRLSTCEYVCTYDGGMFVCSSMV